MRDDAPFVCFLCGATITEEYDLCATCNEDDKRDTANINRLMAAGHTYHCAARQTWSEPETCEGCAREKET